MDRLVALIKTHDESRQHLVNDIVAPYFDELQIAYTAYLGTLRKAKKMVKGGHSFPAIYTEIEALRAADLILRDKLRQMADAYETDLTSYSDLASFFSQAGFLFGYWNGDHHSGTLRILTALREGSGVWSREFLDDSIAMTIDAGEEQWRQLANEYAHIRAKYLRPMKATLREIITPGQTPTATQLSRTLIRCETQSAAHYLPRKSPGGLAEIEGL